MERFLCTRHRADTGNQSGTAHLLELGASGGMPAGEQALPLCLPFACHLLDKSNEHVVEKEGFLEWALYPVLLFAEFSNICEPCYVSLASNKG